MSQTDRRTLRWAGGLLALIVAGGGCQSKAQPPAAKAEPPAKVQNASPESGLATVTLTAEAEKRLGIQTVAASMKRVGRTRTYGGQVVMPPDKTIVASAPVAGRLAEPSGGGVAALVAGERVRKGQPLWRLIPLLGPERDLRIQADRQVAETEARLNAARVRLTRAEQLLRDRAGSARAVDDAKEEVAVLDANLNAARARLASLTQNPFDYEAGLTVDAPTDGIVRNVLVRTGQTIAAGAPLVEIESLDVAWIRVPVYVGDLRSIDRTASASVHDLAAGGESNARRAAPVSALPSADANASTADLYYQLPNTDGALRPGQRVGVTVALRGQEDALTVPWSAILHDINGGTWVYESTAPQVFVKRRVDIRFVSGDLAVIAKGLKTGTPVVTTGAAELFGTEFGVGK